MKLIDRAIELIDIGWTQGANARNANGQSTPADHPHACEFCIMGAFIRASYEADQTVALRHRFRAKFIAVHRIGPEAFNDTKGRTQQEVIEALQRLTLSTQF